MIKNVRKSPTLTMDYMGKEVPIKLSMNAYDYLERVYGDVSTALEKCVGDNPKTRDMKHLIRGFMIDNEPKNGTMLESDQLDRIEPSLFAIGSYYDMNTLQSICATLFDIGMEQLYLESDEQGEDNALIELLVTSIGALSKLYGKKNLDGALNIFGYQPHEIL